MSWLECWAIGRYDLGLSEREFGGLNPAMFDALLVRKQEEHKRLSYYAGLVAAAVYNANPFRGKDAKAVSPLDFLPNDKQVKPQSVEDQVAILTAALGCGPTQPGKARKKKR